MCFPHIINIAVQHVLEKMSSVVPPEVDDDFVDMISAASKDEGRRFGQSFEAACAQDPVARLRRIIMAIRSSGQRRSAFKTWIVTGNRNGLFVFQNDPVQIQPRELLRDVRTRWDSTYQMIRRCIEMRLVSFVFYSMIRMTIYIIYFRPSTPFLHDQEAIWSASLWPKKSGKSCKSSLTFSV